MSQKMLNPLKFVLLLLLGACAFVPKKRITTEILLPAETEKVWAVLSDNEQYGEWNPFIVKSQGEMMPGTKIKNTLRSKGGREIVFRPRIIVVRPNKELRWMGRAFIPGVFDGEHYFYLQSHQGHTQLTHGENFSGFALWFFNISSFEDDFIAMNEALKARLVEQKSTK